MIRLVRWFIAPNSTVRGSILVVMLFLVYNFRLKGQNLGYFDSKNGLKDKI
jgi:hypothetical protein